MGTPDFAVASLEALINAGHNVVGVVTMPDKAVGRHQNQLTPSPVKICALAHSIPVLQPERLKDPEFLDALRALAPDLQVVVAFRMLPKEVWGMPPLGTFNLHASLLPQYRGAAPINWAVINGETETGVTTFLLDHEIDTGRVIHRATLPIGPEDNAGTVHDNLMSLGSELVVRTVNDLAARRVQTVAQEELAVEGPLRSAPKIFKDTCRINWSQRASDVHNFVRGLSPYPAAWTNLLFPSSNKPIAVKVFRTEKSNAVFEAEAQPGALLTDGKSTLAVMTGEGALNILEIQISGKRRMGIEDFLRGFRTEDGMRLA